MSEWTAIIMEFLKAFIECLKERKREHVEADLNDRSPRALLLKARIMRKTLRDKYELHGRELRDATDEGMAFLNEQDAEDISCLLDEAEATSDVEASA